jgi:hypothetical protein
MNSFKSSVGPLSRYTAGGRTGGRCFTTQQQQVFKNNNISVTSEIQELVDTSKIPLKP